MIKGPHRVLLTGGSGFIGQRALPALTAAHPVRILARRPIGAHAGVEAEVTSVDGLRDASTLRNALEGVDVVVHLASVVHRNDASAQEFTDVNVRGTRLLAELALAAGVSHFIYLSSIAAVGNGGGRVIDENTEPHPVTPYGVSKWQAERELFEVSDATSMIASVLRPPMVYGPGMKGNPLRLFRALDRHLPLPFAGNRNHRSSLFVDNLVAAISCLAMQAPHASGIYHVADREIVSTEEFTRASATALGVRALLFPSPDALLTFVGRVGDRVPFVGRMGLTTAFAESVAGSLVVDTSRLERETGFIPPYSQREGLAVTARWFRTSRS